MKGIFKFVRNFLLGFLLTWYAIDMWRLFHGDLRPLWRKGIHMEWLINAKQEEKTDTSKSLTEQVDAKVLKLTRNNEERRAA